MHNKYVFYFEMLKRENLRKTRGTKSQTGVWCHILRCWLKWICPVVQLN